MRKALIVVALVVIALAGYQIFRNRYDDERRAVTRPIQPSENLSGGKPYTDEQIRGASEYMREAKRQQERESATTRPN